MSSLAERTSGYLRALRIPILLLLAAIGALAAYYSIYVTERADYLTGRNLRLVGQLGRQVEAAVADQETVLASYSNYYRPEQFVAFFPCVARLARPHVPMFTYVTLTGPAGGARTDCKAVEGFARADNPAPAPLAAPVIFVERDSGTPWGRRTGPPLSSVNQFVVPIASVVDPLFSAHARAGVFDTLLLATTGGRVIYQAPGSDLRLTTLNRLMQRQEDGSRKEVDFSALPLTSQVLDVELSGGRYKMYLQSCCAALTEGAAAADRPGWLVAGLIANGTVRSDSLAISFSMMALAGAAILFAIFSWPFVKLALIGEGQRLRVRDVLLIGVCAVLATSLVTAGSVDWVAYAGFKSQLDRELQSLSRSVRDKLALEIDLATKQLVQLEAVAANNGNGDRTAAVLAKVAAPAYPFMESFALIDADGMQTRKWSAAGFTTPRISTSHRAYFRHWMQPHPERPAYFLDSIRSGTTGRKEAVLSRAATQPGAAVAALTIPMLSVTEPLLPPGFGFAVIDESGAVLFHSDPEHSLDEQFFLETDRHRRLRAAVAARHDEVVNVRYFGRDHRAYVAPIDRPEGARWSLVTFHDKEPVRTTNIEWLLITLLLTVIYVGIYLAIAAATLVLRPAYRAPWLWPDRARPAPYQRLIVFYAGLALTFAGAIYALRDRSLLALALLLPFIAWGATYVVLTRRAALIRWNSAMLAAAGVVAALVLNRISGDAPGGAPLAVAILLAFGLAALGVGVQLRQSYRAAAALMLVLTAVLPTLAFFKVAHAIQVESFVKYAQLDLARQAQGRTDAARHEARLVAGANGALAEPMTALRNSLSAYHDVFLATELSTDGGDSGICAADAEQAGRSELPKLLEEMLPYYSESSVGMRELLHDSATDKAWQWRRTPRHLTLLARAQSGNDKICVRSAVPRIIPSSDDPAAPALWARASLLGAGLLATAWWVAGFVARRVLLADVVEPLWSTSAGLPFYPGANLYVRWRPTDRDGLGLTADSTRLFDFAEGACAADRAAWFAAQSERLEVAPPGGRIVFDRLEAASGDAPFNKGKLALLKEALDVEHRTVVVVCTMAPHLLARRVADAAGADGETAASWTGVLSRFALIDGARFAAPKVAAAALVGDTVMVPPVQSVARTDFGEQPDRLSDDPAVRSAWEDVERTLAGRVPPAALDREQLVEEIADRLERHYQGVWANYSDAEKRALLHLAEDGLVNEKDRKVVRVLLARGVIRKNPHFTFTDESFRQFVLSRASSAEAVILDRHQDSAWDHVRVPFMAAVIGIAAFFFLTQRELFTTTMAVITALAGGIPAAVRVIGLFERRAGASTE